MKRYDYICVGSSFYCLGFAFNHKNTLIVEEQIVIAPDVCRTYKPVVAQKTNNYNGNVLYNFLSENNRIYNEKVDVPSLSIALADFVMKNNFNILLDARIGQIENTEDGYIVEVITNNNVYNFMCDNLVYPPSEMSEIKHLNCLVYGDKEKLLPCIKNANTGLFESYIDDEYIVSFPFDKSVNLRDAQLSVERIWNEKFSSFGPMDTIAYDFCDTAKHDIIADFVAGAENNDFISVQTNYITEKIDYDLVVVGAGSAGCFCALSAVEQGLKVLCVEKKDYVGGNCSLGLVGAYYHGLDGGEYESVDAANKLKNGTIYKTRNNCPLAKRSSLYEIMKEKGVDFLFSCAVTDVICEDNTVKGIRIYTDKKLIEVSSKFLCDSTAEGFIIKKLNVEYNFGRDTDSVGTPFSFITYFRENETVCSVAHDSGYLDVYDDFSTTQLTLKAQTDFLNITDRRVIFTADTLGCRESLLYNGETNLTFEDVVLGKTDNNVLLYVDSDFDSHGYDYALSSDIFKDFYVHSNLSTVSYKIGLPIGCVVPKGYKGIVSACRCLAVDHYVSSAARMTRDMHRLGESVGIAVSLAIKNNKNSILDVEYDLLKSILIDRNCFDPDENRKYGFEENKIYYPFEWLEDDDEIISALSTLKPGVALWSCKKKSSGELNDKIYDVMQSTSDLILKKNCAIALGIVNDKRSISVLRQCLKNRCDDYLLDCRRTNHMVSIIAISLLGKLKDRESLSDILEIFTEEEYEKEMYHTHLKKEYKFSTLEDFNMVYYHYLLFSAVALKDICKEHNIKISDKIKPFIDNKNIIVDRISIDKDKAYYKTLTDRLFELLKSI